MRRLRKLVYALLAFCVGLALLNVLVASGERLAYGAWWADGRPAGLYREDGPRTPGPNGRFRVQLRPGAELDGWLYKIRVNQLGFRGAELASEKPTNGLRIWCLGGSTTFDIYAPNDALAWPALLQASVQAALPSRSVEVVNAGIPGEVINGNITDLQTLGPRVRPDVVVIYAGPNDLREVITRRLTPSPPTPGGPAPTAAGAPGIPWRERIDFATLRVLDRWAQGLALRPPPARTVALTAEQLAALRARVLSAIDTATAIGAAPLLATHALRAAPDATGDTARRQVAESAGQLEMSPESAIRAFADYNALVTTLARERSLPFADVRAAVPPDDEMWGDATHFRPAGSERAAAVVTQTVLAMGR